MLDQYEDIAGIERNIVEDEFNVFLMCSRYKVICEKYNNLLQDTMKCHTQIHSNNRPLYQGSVSTYVHVLVSNGKF